MENLSKPVRTPTEKTTGIPKTFEPANDNEGEKAVPELLLVAANDNIPGSTPPQLLPAIANDNEPFTKAELEQIEAVKNQLGITTEELAMAAEAIPVTAAETGSSNTESASGVSSAASAGGAAGGAVEGGKGKGSGGGAASAGGEVDKGKVGKILKILLIAPFWLFGALTALSFKAIHKLSGEFLTRVGGASLGGGGGKKKSGGGGH